MGTFIYVLIASLTYEPFSFLFCFPLSSDFFRCGFSTQLMEILACYVIDVDTVLLLFVSGIVLTAYM